MMRKLAGAAAVATLVGSGLAALPAAGAAPEGHARTVEFAGHSTFDFFSPACTLPGFFVHQVFDAPITGKRGGTLHIEGCDDLSGNTSPFAFSGDFTITSSSGRRSITGTVTGTAVGPTTSTCAAGIPGGLDFELTPAADKSKPAEPLAIDGVWCSLVLTTGETGGPISGTISGALPPWLR